MSAGDKLSASVMPHIQIDEVTLSGSPAAKDNTFRWRGDDDKLMLDEAVNKKPKDNGDTKAFLPQSIRSFMITY